GLIRTLVCRKARGHSVLSLCNMADYVPRDLLQAGTAWLTFDIEALWEGNPLGSDAAPEWSLVRAARQYLDDRFFHASDSLLVHSLTARAIAGGLVADRPTTATIESLMSEHDGYFTYRLPTYHRKRLEHVRTLARTGRLSDCWVLVGTFDDVSLRGPSRFAMEDEL